jgi:catechol 2,3-dioxygenase-like lactoylglutathione lyase family enzyme
MSAVERIHHTALTVTDLERSLRFYRDMLGFEEVIRRRIDGGYIGTLMGRPNLRMELVILQAGPTKLELIAYREPHRTVCPPADGNPGAMHITLLVDDVRAWHARLAAAGVESQSPPVAIDDGPNAGGWAVMLLDPDGTWVELLELTTARREALGFSPRPGGG